MRKKWFLLVMAGLLGLTSVNFVSAAQDPNATTVAYIGYSQNVSCYTDKVRGKAYALSTNPNFSYINVHGTFYQGATLLQSGTGTTSSSGSEASWYTSDCTYSHTTSYKLQAASRTYYKNGTSSDQMYDIYNW